MPLSRSHKLVVLGGERVGKTAIIEQFIFGNHVVGQVSLARPREIAVHIKPLFLAEATCVNVY